MLRYQPLRFIGHQRWLREGIRHRVLRAFHADVSRSPALRFETRFMGQRYQGALNNPIDWQVYFYGAYERYILMLIRDILRKRPSPVFLDVGANVGQHTLFASQYASAVHAVEPFEPVRAQLVQNLALNRVRNVIVHPFALGERSETLPFHAPQGSLYWGMGSFADSNLGPARSVRVMRGDDLALPGVDLIKIDVEGFEVEALRGLRDTLRRFRPIVIFEGSHEITRGKLGTIAALQALFPPGYKLFNVHPRHVVCGVFEIARYRLTPMLRLEPVVTSESLAVPDDY